MNIQRHSLVDAVGNTPLIRLSHILPPEHANRVEVYAKLEFLNPMGSVKDRIARHMILKAEADGRLAPGRTILENSSGNTALGLAMMGIQRGYTVRMVVRDSISREKLNQLRSLGVILHLVDHSLPPDHPDSYNNLAPRLARENPDWFFPDQHNNRENSEAHYVSTGPEIWSQMEGRVDLLVAGIGTGGTICGCSRFLKEQNPRLKAIAIDSQGSVFTSYFKTGTPGPASPYLIEGLGDEFIIGCPDFSLIDDIIPCSDRNAFLWARELVLREACMGGGSSGAAIWGILQLLPHLPDGTRLVTLFPDGTSRYLSTIFNDEWMRAKGFLDS